MAKLTLDQLKTRVKIKVDEYTPSGVSHAFDDYLEPMLNESADELTDKAPKWLLDPAAIALDDKVHDDDLYYVPVPDDFSRLYDAKFPLWDRPVYEVLSQGSPEYRQQDNEYLKAGYGRPVAMLRPYDPVGTDPLDLYIVFGKVLDGAEPLYARYIAYKAPASMPEVLDEALTWLAASKILQILEYANQAKLAYDNHIAELQNKAR